MVRSFRVVPGGDGQALRPGFARHFTYRVDLGAGDRAVPVRGRIRAVRWAP